MGQIISALQYYSDLVMFYTFLIVLTTFEGHTGSPLKLYFQIPYAFPVFPLVRLQIFPVPIYVICHFYIHKTDSAGISSFFKDFKIAVANITKSFTFRITPANTQRKYNVVQRCKKVIFTTL